MQLLNEKKIEDYLKGYGKLFVCHTANNIHKCGQFLSGLLHECKSNIERMVERIPDSDYDQLQHFISNSPWDSVAVMNSVAEKVHHTLTHTPVGDSCSPPLGLLLDESGWEKAGKMSVGVSRQYIGQVGKVCNGQIGVFAALSDGEQVGLLEGRLYLPQEWVDDTKRCEQANIPEDERIYRTKPELAVEILKSIPAQVTYDWVGGDDIYGNSFTVRKHLYDQKKAFVLDVSDSLGVYLTLPELYVPLKKAGRGREPSQLTCDDKPVQLKDLLKQIPEQDWQTITHRQGTKGPMTRKACIIDVYIWKSQRGGDIETVQLLISTETDGSEIKYSLCYSHEGKMDIHTALYRQMQRYWIERAFQNVKEQLGLHQYQVRSWKAWHHHIALTLMALHFLLQIQKEDKEEIPLLSIPDIKLIFAKKLLNKLNSDEGIRLAIQLRHRKRQADLDMHSRVPK